MITLKDYIGKIYKEVTNAKVQSDIETLAIAQEYVQNPMLKHFSVPNIRIKDMELTIPVAVDATQSVSRDYTESEIQKVYTQAFEKVYLSFYPYKTTYLASINPDVSQKAQDLATTTAPELQISREVSQVEAAPTAETKDTGEVFKTTETGEVFKTADLAASTQESYTAASTTAATKFADIAYRFVDTEIQQADFYAAIVPEIASQLQPRPYVLESLPVIVETQRLSAINDPASMITIKVNITDDAMEWTTDLDEDGNTTQVLNYE